MPMQDLTHEILPFDQINIRAKDLNALLRGLAHGFLDLIVEEDLGLAREKSRRNLGESLVLPGGRSSAQATDRLESQLALPVS